MKFLTCGLKFARTNIVVAVVFNLLQPVVKLRMKIQNIFTHTYPPTRPSRTTAGFTFIELVVIMVVIAVMSAIAFSGLIKWVPNYRLKGASQELYASMQKAKLEAVKRNKNVGIQFTTTGCPPDGGGYTVFLDENGNQTQDLPGDNTLFSVAMPKGTCITATTLDADNDGFTPQGLALGLAVAPGGSRTVTLGHVSISRTYTMTMSIAGAINMQ